MSSTERGLRLIAHLGAVGAVQSHGELCRCLEIPRSTLSDLLRELCASGHIRRVGRGYVLGTESLAMVRGVCERTDLRPGLAPVMHALAETTGETCLLSIELPGEGMMVAVDQVQGPRPLRFVASPGRVFPMINSPSGHVMLAFSGRTGADLPPAAVMGVPDAPRPELVPAQLLRVRRRGLALSGREEEGHSSIAAPVLNHRRQVIGALSLVGPVDRIRRRRTYLAGRLLDAVRGVRPYAPAG